MTITAIAPQKHRKNHSSVFVDGAFAFGMSDEDIMMNHLAEGMDISQERLDYLTDHVIYTKAQEKAMRYLATQPRSQYEVEKKLREDAYSDETIERVVSLLLRYGYINDAQFAVDYAQSRKRHGQYGPSRIRAELRRKGVGPDHISEALQQEDGEYDEVSAIIAYLGRKRIVDITDSIKRKRIVDALHRRGFAYGPIQAALKRFTHNCDE